MNWCEVTPQSLIGRHGRNLCLFIPRLEKLKKERIVLLHSFIDSFFGLFIHIIQVKKSYHSPSRPHLVKVRLLTDSHHTNQNPRYPLNLVVALQKHHFIPKHGRSLTCSKTDAIQFQALQKGNSRHHLFKSTL